MEVKTEFRRSVALIPIRISQPTVPPSEAGRIRTHDLGIKSPLLYQLSYDPSTCICPPRDSNSHFAGFESASSADWDRGAHRIIVASDYALLGLAPRYQGE